MLAHYKLVLDFVETMHKNSEIPLFQQYARNMGRIVIRDICFTIGNPDGLNAACASQPPS
jgi:hypothetical protein